MIHTSLFLVQCNDGEKTWESEDVSPRYVPTTHKAGKEVWESPLSVFTWMLGKQGALS